ALPPACIVELDVTGGFLSDVAARFHPGLNAILGGKGVGKSLLVEFLRFALDQPSHDKAIQTDMQGKLEKQLGLGGKVSVLFQLPSGTRYRVTRTFDKVKNPIDVHHVETGEPYEGDLSKLFQVLFYSQNEIIDISRDPDCQLTLIDKLV